MKHTALFFALALLITSCKLDSSCPDDVFLGEADLFPSSVTYFPYDGTETLVFEDEFGDSLVLVNRGGKVDTLSDIILSVPCNNLPDPQYIYFRGRQIYTIWYNNRNNQAVLWHTVRVEQAAATIDTVPVDRFAMGQFDENGRSYGTGPYFVLTDRGNTDDIAEGYLEAPENRLYPIEDTVLHGRAFSQIFRNNPANLTIPESYWSPTLGTVAFRDRFNKLWVLDTIR
jgi:hypothetical protein